MRDRPLILGVLALLLVILAAPFWYGVLAHTDAAAPVIPPAKGAHCVRPRKWMLENHMKLLMQVRYEVVHEGIAPKDETLPACMSCHVSKLADGKYPSVRSKKFFCTACHDYVGVRVDCFSCHTNRPGGNGEAVAEGQQGLSQAGKRLLLAVAGASGKVPVVPRPVQGVASAAPEASGRSP
jgi:hypothetical protein